jgi:hypothetical protein
MWVSIQTYALGALSLGLNLKLLQHLEFGLNGPTFVVGSLTAVTVYFLINAHRLNGAR